MDPADDAMTGQERDTAMASFINAHRTGYDHTLVLSGNIHSSTSVGTPWNKNYRPMGSELRSMAKDLNGNDLLNALVRSETVNAWNCGGSDESACKAYHGTRLPTDDSRALPVDSYFVSEGRSVDGHNASFFIRSTRASLPFLTN